MSNIIIRVPNNKELVYTAANLVNTAAQAAATTGIAYAKQGLYSGALATEPIVFDYYTDKLRTQGAQYDNNLILRSSNGTQIEFMDAIIDVTQANIVKSTSLINRAGSVKEFIQKDDYNITIKGNLICDRDKFPYGLLNTLLTILDQPESFEVANVYLETFGICNMILKDAKFEQSTIKYMNAMPFTLTFTSDEDYNFLIEDE